MTSQIITLGVLLACIVLLGGMFYQVIAPFLLPLFLAAILSILCQPLHLRILARTGNRAPLAAGLTTALVMLMLVTPLMVMTLLGTVELMRLTQNNFQNWDWSRGLEQLGTEFLEPALEKLSIWLPGVIDEAQIEKMKVEFPESGKAVAINLVGKTFFLASSSVGALLSLMVSGGMFLVALYYFLADGPALVVAAGNLIPLPVEHQRQLRDQFCKVVRAVVLATFLAAFAQGVATAVALQAVGMGHFFVFLFAATIAALVPLAGTWIVWGPCAAWLAFQGHWGTAIGLALFGMIVVGLLDNVIRTYVLNSDAQLHPLLAFVSVLGALQVMGLWGIFFGPIVASCLYALVQIFNMELQSLSVTQEKQVEQPASLDVKSLTPAVSAPPLTAVQPKPGSNGKKKHRR